MLGILACYAGIELFSSVILGLHNFLPEVFQWHLMIGTIKRILIGPEKKKKNT